MNLKNAIVGLYRLASTDLPGDVESALIAARKKEARGSNARLVLGSILENIKLARENSVPICQDTGLPVFYASIPHSMSEGKIESAIISATKAATRAIPLRPNAVESISGRNSSDNTGRGIPEIHISRWGRKHMHFELLMKGAGSENIGQCYRLPDACLRAERDLAGVEKCVLDAIVRAQGRGCPPMVVGVAIAGSRSAAAFESKRQLLRNLREHSKNKILAGLERGIFSKANRLGIGPAGLGGKTTLLGVKISTLSRHPASYFVDVSFSCWALRRRSMNYSKGGYG